MPSNSKIQRSPLVWPGGKALIFRQIQDLIPSYTIMADVFGGGGFTLNLPERKGSIEVFNDINDELINFYLVRQRHPEEFLRLWELTPRSIGLFNNKHLGELATDIERAVAFLSQNTFGFNGKRETFSKTRGEKRNTSLVGKIDKLSALVRRFDKVTILNQDVFSLLDFYDSETAFFFLDPPYLTGDQSLYGSHSEFDHQRLSATLPVIKGKYLLTIDDSPLARDLYLSADINFKEVRQKSSLSPSKRQMNQLAIHNY